MKNLPVGKLNPELLNSLFSGYKITDPTVFIGPQIGEDAAVIDIGHSYLVAKTDPITFATDEIGWYLVCINSNDIATMGARPRWLLVTLLLPEEKTTEHLVRDIFTQITSACEQFSITLCGGHTEITYGIDRPIVIGQMLGQVSKDRLITSSGAKIGDDILLTKGIAVEAVSIIARERKELLISRGYSDQYLAKARNYLKEPGISILKESIIALNTGGVHAMHDPTEGGLVTGLREMARCSQLGMVIWPERIHIFPECRDFCEEFHLDPLGIIASGGLLIASEPSYSEKIINALAENNIVCAIIGKFIEPDKGMFMENKSEKRPLPVFHVDEITKVFKV